MATPIGIWIYTALNGVEVGRDTQGNRYYRERHEPDGRRRKRWVIYKGEREASRVPPEWHGWLHYTVDETPEEAPPLTKGAVRRHAYRESHIQRLIPDRPRGVHSIAYVTFGKPSPETEKTNASPASPHVSRPSAEANYVAARASCALHGVFERRRGRVGGVVAEPLPAVTVGMRIAAHPPRRSGRGRRTIRLLPRVLDGKPLVRPWVADGGAWPQDFGHALQSLPTKSGSLGPAA